MFAPQMIKLYNYQKISLFIIDYLYKRHKLLTALFNGSMSIFMI